MSPANAAMRRLAQVAPAAGLRPADAAPLLSHSNDAWRIGEVILRICWRGDRRRLLREAALAAALPPAFGYPEVLAAGQAEGATWMATRRVPGETLGAAWPADDAGRRRAIIDDYANRLKALHAWRPAGALAQTLLDHALAAPMDPEDVIGADVIPLPLPRAKRLVDPVADLPFVDPGLVRAAGSRMLDLAHLDPFGGLPAGSIAHGDAHMGNVLIDGDRVVAMLDLEWARLAPPWIELVTLRRDAATDPRIAAFDRDLRLAYPALFDVPRLRERLWLCDLAYTLRHILVWPPDAPEPDLRRDHPLHRLRRLTQAPIAWA